MISGRTALYGVVGHPVAHSLSPAMHAAAYAAAGLDAAYVAFDVEPGRLADALGGAHALGLRGLNVTVPHKQAAAAACAALDPVARDVGAVNTLRRTDAGWEGHNTDAPATAELLAAAGVGRGARAVLAGAGGAARAAAWALLRLGARLRIAARRVDAAEALCRAVREAVGGGDVSAVPMDRLGAEVDAADVLVNATSVGLAGHDGTLPAYRLAAGQVALDYVYGETALARAARAAGARLVTGEEVLVRQGALAFTLWTGRPAPEAAMAAAVAAARRSTP